MNMGLLLKGGKIETSLDTFLTAKKNTHRGANHNLPYIPHHSFEECITAENGICNCSKNSKRDAKLRVSLSPNVLVAHLFSSTTESEGPVGSWFNASTVTCAIDELKSCGANRDSFEHLGGEGEGVKPAPCPYHEGGIGVKPPPSTSSSSSIKNRGKHPGQPGGKKEEESGMNHREEKPQNEITS